MVLLTLSQLRIYDSIMLNGYLNTVSEIEIGTEILGDEQFG